MNTSQHPAPVPVAARLVVYRWGRVLMHLGGIAVHPTHAHWDWHWRGILRELTPRRS